MNRILYLTKMLCQQSHRDGSQSYRYIWWHFRPGWIFCQNHCPQRPDLSFGSKRELLR